MTSQRFLKRCCWSGCGKVKPWERWERGVFLCTLADVCSSFGHKVRTLHLCPWLLPSKWPLLSPARDSPSETCTNPKGEATDSCWHKNSYWWYFANLCSRTCMNKGFTLYGNISIYFPGVARCCICHFMSLQCFLHFSTFEAKVPTSCGDCFSILRRWWTSFGLQFGCASSAWTLGTHEAGVVLQCNIRIALWHDHMCGSHVWIRVGICWITLIISRSNLCGCACCVPACHFSCPVTCWLILSAWLFASHWLHWCRCLLLLRLAVFKLKQKLNI